MHMHMHIHYNAYIMQHCLKELCSLGIPFFLERQSALFQDHTIGNLWFWNGTCDYRAGLQSALLQRWQCRC